MELISISCQKFSYFSPCNFYGSNKHEIIMELKM